MSTRTMEHHHPVRSLLLAALAPLAQPVKSGDATRRGLRRPEVPARIVVRRPNVFVPRDLGAVGPPPDDDFVDFDRSLLDQAGLAGRSQQETTRDLDGPS